MKMFKQTTLFVAMLLGLILPQMQANAQTAAEKPMAIVAINNYNDLSKDLVYLLDLVGPPGTAQMLQQQGAGFAQMLDVTKPIGVLVQPDGILGAKLLAFIPTNNVDQILLILAGFGIVGESTPEGLTKIDAGGTAIYIKQGAGWAFVSNTKEALASPPADPAALLGGLDKQYDVAIQGNIDAIPEVFKQLMMSQIQVGMQQSIQEPLPNETEDAFEARRALAQQGIQDVQKMINELESITAGFNIDQTRQSVYLDFSVTAKEGTDTAKQFAEEDTTTQLAGFLTDSAAVQMNVASTFDTAQADQINISLETLRTQAIAQIQNDPTIPNEELRALAIKAISTFMDVGKATLSSGKIDLAGSVNLTDTGISVVAAAVVPQAEQLDQIVREFVKIASEQDPSFPKVEIDALKKGGTSFHVIRVPIPEYETEARSAFGDAVEISIGMGPDRVYIGVGKDNLKQLEAAIDASAANKGKTVSAGLLKGSVNKILQFAAEQTQDLTLQQAAAAAASVAGKDTVSMEATTIKNGGRYRIELEAGVLKAIAVGVMAAQAEAGLDDSPF
ncbi:MAG: hypothetical protein HON92_04215 [Planctomycetaceae bacterium]|nr:hypothetical protein [Planctomycetaceae bacterium]MBT5123157.1 hypothetical protein [Planctomycetaceae bacterium]MBT5882863.1 hypothetical protein [Planctomycetaceae bacterium]